MGRKTHAPPPPPPACAGCAVADTEIKPLIRLIGVAAGPMWGTRSCWGSQATPQQGLRSLPRGGALSPNFAALLKASPASPSWVLRGADGSGAGGGKGKT